MSNHLDDPAGAERDAVKRYRMLIGGEWREARDGDVLASVDPATEEVIAHFPHAKADDVDDAVQAAKQGFSEWSRRTWSERARAMRELAGRMTECADRFAVIDTRDSGTPIRAMRRDARGAPSEMFYFAGLASELKGVSFTSPADVTAATFREPYGVVGRIIPFNHPYRFCAKVAPILAAGNAVILKPSEATSLSAFDFGGLTVGLLPDGVVNVVSGLGATAGSAIVRHPDVPRIAFTGGVPTGKAIAREAAEHMKRCSFELGGKNPMIVFPDVDIQKAVTGCVRGMSMTSSMGQSCQSNSRVFVHEAVHDAFLGGLVRALEELTIGDPLDEAIDMGPLAFEAHYERVLAMIELGKSEGARLLTGGKRPGHLTRGFFVEPTVFADVQPTMRIAQEEIFGPVISVFKWNDWDAMVVQANDVRFGLTANIWTNDLGHAHRTAKAIQAGVVWVNGVGGRVSGAPLGGYKESGIGKEGDLSDLLSYTQEKLVQIHFD